jgi:hypothetical protein
LILGHICRDTLAEPRCGQQNLPVERSIPCWLTPVPEAPTSGDRESVQIQADTAEARVAALRATCYVTCNQRSAYGRRRSIDFP